MHYRNIRALVTTAYKVQQELSPPLLNEVFVVRDCNYNFRRNTESAFYLVPMIWDIFAKGNKGF